MGQPGRPTHLNIVEKNARQTGAGNDETIKTFGRGVAYYDPAGSSRTGLILEAGRENGQIIRVVNIADDAETMTFAADATSNVASGTDAVIGQNQAMVLVWDAATELWYGALGAASIADGGIATAKLADNAVTSAKIAESVVQTATVTLTATEIVGTSAGDIGHSAGAVLVAAPGAGKILEFVSATLIYTFDTAAYTGGNNDLVIRQGTTAVSAAIADADLIGDSADDIACVNALSAADIKLTQNSTLNLAGTAYTQPGTAAGTLSARITYRVHTV